MFGLLVLGFSFSETSCLLRHRAQDAAAISNRATTKVAQLVLAATMIGAMIRETRLTTLIMGFKAGPAVSFNGSPTVSPTTLALWRSLPLPVFAAKSRGSSSIVFFAL